MTKKKELKIVKNNQHISDYNHTLAIHTNMDYRAQYQNSKGEYDLTELYELEKDLVARLAFVQDQIIKEEFISNLSPEAKEKLNKI